MTPRRDEGFTYPQTTRYAHGSCPVLHSAGQTGAHLRCPQCHNKLLQKSGTSTRLRIKGMLEIGDDGIAKAQCYWCNTAVTLPLELKKAADDEERFTIQLNPPVT